MKTTYTDFLPRVVVDVPGARWSSYSRFATRGCISRCFGVRRCYEGGTGGASTVNTSGVLSVMFYTRYLREPVRASFFLVFLFCSRPGMKKVILIDHVASQRLERSLNTKRPHTNALTTPTRLTLRAVHTLRGLRLPGAKWTGRIVPCPWRRYLDRTRTLRGCSSKTAPPDSEALALS